MRSTTGLETTGFLEEKQEVNAMHRSPRRIELEPEPPEQAKAQAPSERQQWLPASQRRDRFEQAFTFMHWHDEMRCSCGKTFYNWDPPYGMDDEDLDYYRSMGAEPVGHDIAELRFNGKVYAAPCSCWHKEAERYMGWLDHYREQVAKYLNTVRADQLLHAQQMPVVDEG